MCALTMTGLNQKMVIDSAMHLLCSIFTFPTIIQGRLLNSNQHFKLTEGLQLKWSLQKLRSLNINAEALLPPNSTIFKVN